MMKPEKLNLVSEWDKTFPKSKSVSHKKVTFVNRYGVTLAADMYTPESPHKKIPALAVCGPFGAVKEQCSGLYAQTMAERGYLTIAIVHRRKRWPASLYGIPGHQHRGLYGRSRLSLGAG